MTMTFPNSGSFLMLLTFPLAAAVTVSPSTAAIIMAGLYLYCSKVPYRKEVLSTGAKLSAMWPLLPNIIRWKDAMCILS